jgi:hypothetical protein
MPGEKFPPGRLEILREGTQKVVREAKANPEK